MIDDDRKLLTEFLGECWQTAENSWGQDFPCHNRQFDDNWQDFGALVDRLKELGLWKEITEHLECKFLLDKGNGRLRCQDIAEFLRGKNDP